MDESYQWHPSTLEVTVKNICMMNLQAQGAAFPS